MTCRNGWRLVARALAALSTVATLSSVQAADAAVAAEAPAVRGFIVRLKSAAPHAGARLAPTAGERAAALAASDHDITRIRRAMLESGIASPAVLRPVGRDQQLLALERPMSAGAAQSAMASLRARADVEWVEPNTRERRLQVPNDPFFTDGSQWWLKPAGGSNGNVLSARRRGLPGFQTAWLQPGGTGSAAAVVAVLDTGMTPHPDLVGRLLPGYDFVSDVKFANDGDGRDNDPSDPGDFVSSADLADAHYSGCSVADSSWHGTEIAGILAAQTNNAEGVAGIAWNGRVLPVRVAGKCGADVADIIDGMRWAAGLAVAGVPTINPNPVRIINISFGGSAVCGAAYQTAIDELKALGVIVVAAAGNEHTSPTRPANCRGVVGVTALNRDGFKTHYSNFGSELSASGVATIGGDDGRDATARWNTLADEGIITVGNSGQQAPSAAGYFHLWGTSFAAPIVSGTASLMLSVNPQLTAQQLIDGLRRSARPHVTSPSIGACSWQNPGRCACTTATCGAGIVDAEQALLYAANPTTYVAPARTAEILDNAELAAAAALGPDRAANPSPPVEPPAPSSGGGGAMSWGWLLALGLAVPALSASRIQRRRSGR